jgi:hypothetical protein
LVVNVVPSAPLPTVTTELATSVTSTSATLNATVNPNGSSTSARFDWGYTTSYGNQAAAIPAPGSGTSAVPVSAALTGLTCNTIYHFRVTATNAAGSTSGADKTFVTPPTGCPFYEPVLVPGVTPIRAVHVGELRVRIDLLRTRYGLPPFTWTDPSFGSGTTLRAQHVLDLRAALAEAYVAAMRPMPTYIDPSLGPGTIARAVHVMQIREAVVDLE